MSRSMLRPVAPPLSAEALSELRRLLGDEAVRTDPASLAEFRDPYSPPSWRQHEPAAVLEPASAGQVQDIVRMADRYRFSLWTFSQGRNYGYGGPAPRQAGCAALSLRGLNRILEINEDLAYAVVEPGVRFLDLHEELRGRKIPLWPSIPDLGWGSVIGNTLDHGVGFTPLGDHPGRSCGMEVVLADGSLLRTGMGGQVGNPAWHVRKHAYGPSAEGIFMQSNFGIVTKMGCWLMPEPEAYISADVRVEREEDIVPLLETVRPLLLDGTIQNYPIVYNATLVGGAFSGVPRGHWYAGEGSLPGEAIGKMMAETGCGAWFMRFALYGPAAIVDEQYAACVRAFGTITGARMSARRMRGGEVHDTLSAAVPPPPGPAGAVGRLRQQSDTTQAGIPTLDLLDNLSWEDAGAGGHLDYSPVAPLDGEEALRQSRWLRGVFTEHGFDYAASLMLTPRAFINITSVWFNTASEEQARRAYDFIGRLIRLGAERGYPVYRTHLEYMDSAAQTFDFNDHAQARFNQRLKDALDPSGIFSPGKQGIWPSAR
jgi:4-cresol dehydrogenase (hydroxylating) flavoprotein subunit